MISKAIQISSCSPKISIITPSFNAGQYIERAIQSVQIQYFDSWEHIIVDGASSDGSLEIIRKYPHIRWISEPDRGVFDAMNKGIKLATGDWIYFLGADDRFHDNEVISNFMAQYSNSNYDVVYGQVKMENSGWVYYGEFDIHKLINCNIHHQSIFYKKGVFDKIGLFDPKYEICADHAHNIKWFTHPEIKYHFYNSIISTFGQNGLSSYKEDKLFIKELKSLIIQNAGLYTFLSHYYIIPIKKWLWKNVLQRK